MNGLGKAIDKYSNDTSCFVVYLGCFHARLWCLCLKISLDGTGREAAGCTSSLQRNTACNTAL